jgi:LPXTG-site transpeptidase (sortase) family protein
MTALTRQARFYGLVMALNCIVIIMFQVVTTPTPVVQAYRSSLPTKVQMLAPVVSGTPNRLVVESVGVDVLVDIGTYDPVTDTWTIGEDRAYYADNTVPTNNNNGTTLIYGHALDTMFAPLLGIQSGATAYVYTDKGRVVEYRYESVSQLDPADTSVFSASGPPLLKLQTCSGPLDIYRSMYTFEYIGETKA